MIRFLFVLALLVLLHGFCNYADAKCGGGAARGRMAERRTMRRAPAMMSYSRSTAYMRGPSMMRAAPACEMPPQAPKAKGK